MSTKITIAGEAVVFTSSMKLEDLAYIAKYRPEALVLMGGEDGKEPVFNIVVDEGSTGGISKYGAKFGAASNDDAKLATITMSTHGIEGDISEAIADIFGSAIASLDKLEETLPAVIEEIKSEKAAIMDKIEVVQ